MTDGASNTLLLSECARRPKFFRFNTEYTKNKGNDPAKPLDVNKGGGWAAKENAIEVSGATADGTVEVGTGGTKRSGGPLAVNATNEKNVYAMHTGGANAAFLDGSVRFLSDRLDIKVLAALATRANGEVVPNY
ncbi:hypothetical protein VT84_28180 [Gemmata sp. SH-PL17]|nr:hypothetical protein VT84_28180 [Gemmata sp. SH-PL17]